jgi:hypothetical protein
MVYTLTGLAEGTVHTLKVQCRVGDAAIDGDAAWSGVTTVTTLTQLDVTLAELRAMLVREGIVPGCGKCKCK